MRRYSELDAIRGIAALVVVLHHIKLTALPEVHWGTGLISQVITHPRLWLEIPPIKLFTAGHSAVLVFFVLSGFVLSIPITSRKQPDYRRYLIKRFFRIYIPFAFVILLAVVLFELVQPSEIVGLTDGFNRSWTEAISWKMVLVHLLMSGSDTTLDSPIWSLVHEVRISIIFPALSVLVIRRPLLMVIFSTVISTVLIGLQRYGYLSGGFVALHQDLGLSIESTIMYAAFFIAGIALASNVESITAAIKSLAMWNKLLLWILMSLLLEYPSSFAFADILIGIGAVLLIALCVSSDNTRKILDHRMFYWLGRISYSLYLTHFIVLMTVAHLLFGKLPLWLILCVVFVLSLTVAELMCRLVELPALRLGRRLSK